MLSLNLIIVSKNNILKIMINKIKLQKNILTPDAKIVGEKPTTKPDNIAPKNNTKLMHLLSILSKQKYKQVNIIAKIIIAKNSDITPFTV